MKAVEYNGVEYQRLENMFDIGDERFVVFKQWLLQIFEEIDKPSFVLMYNKVIKYFNAQDSYKIMVELENFKKSLDLMNLNYDAYSICFALLHLQTGELQNNTSTDYQLKKLENMRKDKNLTRGEMEETVENFIKASPKHFRHFLEMLEIVQEMTKAEISSVFRG